MAFIEILVNNLMGYDGVVLFTVASFNIIFWWLTRSSVKRLEDGLYKKVDKVLIKKNTAALIDTPSPEEADKLKRERDTTNRWYSIFTSIISIFPYLGILGTVYSLIGVAGDSGFDNMQDSFLIALTSTFWGVIFAIGFKVFGDAPLLPKVEQYNADVDRLLNRYENAEIDDMEE